MGQPVPAHRGRAQLPSRRRGGLVEHTAQMMRVATGDRTALPELNLDLLLTGILFTIPENSWRTSCRKIDTVMSYDELGELMGHISIGLELVNALWRRLSVENADAWKNLTPASRKTCECICCT